MKTNIAIIIKVIICLSITSSSCQTRELDTGKKSWDGIFLNKERGDLKAQAQFDFDTNEGLIMFPDIIPVPLTIRGLSRTDDSISFEIGFRSGPGYCKGILLKDSIKGVMIKEGLQDVPFWLSSSDELIVTRVEKPSADEPFVITTQKKLPSELKVKQQLEAVLNEYDLEPFIYTKKVNIHEGMIPHSHPVLTLNTSDETETGLLATFLHEQMHWYSLTGNPNFDKVDAILKDKYQSVPVKLPVGAGSKMSTYIHLTVCYLEYDALRKLIGREPAMEHMKLMTTKYYQWVYQTIIEDESYFDELFTGHDLLITP